jgi:hypothetical protein
MRLLADRESNGMTVRLFWDEGAEAGRDAVVKYRDIREGVAFALRLPRSHALDAYYHPNSYRDWAEWLLEWPQAQAA